MCGIAGYIQRHPDPTALSRMLSALAHRGPDGQGKWESTCGQWYASLGHRRLAIIDLATGAQPMANEDGSIFITYNGEIYNFLDLRSTLQQQGHVFRTQSDTETVIHHYEQYGLDGISELNGMFAFAIWDAGKQRLVLARDRAGIKPVFYAELPDGGVTFSSELFSLLAHGRVGSTIDVDGLVSYFFSDYVHPPHSMIRGVKKLAPGHIVVWEDGHLHAPRAYWEVPPPAAQLSVHDDALHAAQLWERLQRAVEAQLISDVPVGIFLSGGIDSSCVATLAAKRATHRMKAFSIGFDNPTFDETRYARLVGGGIGVDHVCETLNESNLLDVIDAALDYVDEPLADPSFLPTFLLSRLAANHVKVVVGGDGGDELWGGYPTYRAHRYASIYRRVPTYVRTPIASAIDRMPVDERYQSLEWKLRRFTHRWDDDMVTRHLRWMSTVDLPELPRAIPESSGRIPATLSAHLPHTSDAMHRMLALDFVTYMPGSVLTKVDRASMAHGLEVRPPMLDNDIIAFAFSLHSQRKIGGGSGKYILKRAARGHVPDDIIDRQKKGFAIPLGLWMRGALRGRMESVFERSPAWDLGLLERSVFKDWKEQHSSKKQDRSKPLWALLVLDHWLRRVSTLMHSLGPRH